VPKRTEAPAQQITINTPAQSSAATDVQETVNRAEREEKEPGWFFDEMNKVPTNEWEKIYHLELQRLEPKVPGVAGSKGYLWTFFGPVTLADIKKRWGGGKFRMDLCKNGHYWRTHNFDIEGEPIYDRSREIPPANGNNGNGAASVGSDFMKILEQQNERLYQVLTTLQGAGKENPAISSAVDILTSAYKTGLSAVAAKPGESGNDPMKQFEMVLAVAERIASVRSNGGSGGLTDAIKTLSELGVLQKPKTLAEQIAEAKALKDLLSGEGGEPLTWGQMAVKAASEHLPEILDTLKTIAPAPRAANQPPGQTREALRVVPIDRSQPQPAAQPAAAAPAAPTTPAIRVEGGLNLESRDGLRQGDAGQTPAPVAAVAAEVMPASQPAPVPVSQEQYDEGMKVQVVNMFRYGASGSAIAAFLEDIKPEMAEDIAKYPAQTITEFFSKDPILKLMVMDPRWPEVLADAREYLSEEVPAN
jgi:hypothetical protein